MHRRWGRCRCTCWRWPTIQRPGRGIAILSLKTLAEFDRRYGPYPYKIITVIDPEQDSQIGGMEYPTLFTGETSWWEPTHVTELTAEHEFGHQYWYGMVATNEFEDAWLDEGINSYTEVNVLDSILGRNTSVLRPALCQCGRYELQRLEYAMVPDFDPVTRWAYKFRNPYRMAASLTARRRRCWRHWKASSAATPWTRRCGLTS